MSGHSSFSCGAASLSKAAIMLGAWLLGTSPAVVCGLLFGLYLVIAQRRPTPGLISWRRLWFFAPF
ncbi:MAG: hypothetical protein ACRYG8_42955 [Janthinobacterium lividum]